eukprot:277671-Lingulodinium_polyedra.AAC.1
MGIPSASSTLSPGRVLRAVDLCRAAFLNRGIARRRPGPCRAAASARRQRWRSDRRRRGLQATVS